MNTLLKYAVCTLFSLTCVSCVHHAKDDRRLYIYTGHLYTGEIKRRVVNEHVNQSRVVQRVPENEPRKAVSNIFVDEDPELLFLAGNHAVYWWDAGGGGVNSNRAARTKHIAFDRHRNTWIWGDPTTCTVHAWHYDENGLGTNSPAASEILFTNSVSLHGLVVRANPDNCGKIFWMEPRASQEATHHHLMEFDYRTRRVQERINTTMAPFADFAPLSGFVVDPDQEHIYFLDTTGGTNVVARINYMDGSGHTPWIGPTPSFSIHSPKGGNAAFEIDFEAGRFYWASENLQPPLPTPEPRRYWPWSACMTGDTQAERDHRVLEWQPFHRSTNDPQEVVSSITLGRLTVPPDNPRTPGVPAAQLPSP